MTESITPEVAEYLDYLQSKIREVYVDANPIIERLFAEERSLCEKCAPARTLEAARNARSKKIYDTEAAVQPMKQMWLRTALALEAGRPPRPIIITAEQQ